MSTKRTVTTRRSSPPAAAGASGEPQFRQKRATSGFSCPQTAQRIIPPA
jgi:hypothetical protein